MRIAELAALYVLVGVGAAAGLLAVRRPLTPATFVDAALLGTFWPLYGPFVLLQGRADAETAGTAVEAGLDEAPLAALLPDRATAEALEERLRLAEARIAEIDALLRQPALDEAAAEARWRALDARGDARAAATARQRVQSIRRLRGLRQRFADELVEVREIVAQFRIQAEVVRLSGEGDGAEARSLLDELHARLDALDEMLGEPAGDEDLAERAPAMP
jgi:hypothetical protein